MDVSQIDSGQTVFHSGFIGIAEAVRNSLVVNGKSQQPCHQSLVGSMALAGGQKGAVEEDVGLPHGGAQQLSGDNSDFHSSCGMGAGGSHHHGTDNVE